MQVKFPAGAACHPLQVDSEPTAAKACPGNQQLLWSYTISLKTCLHSCFSKSGLLHLASSHCLNASAVYRCYNCKSHLVECFCCTKKARFSQVPVGMLLQYVDGLHKAQLLEDGYIDGVVSKVVQHGLQVCLQQIIPALPKEELPCQHLALKLHI